LNQYQQLELSINEREEIIGRLETLILSKVLWIQDVDPINWKIFSTFYKETSEGVEGISLLDWWAELPLLQIGKSLFQATFSIHISALILGLLAGLWLVHYFWKWRLHAVERSFSLSYFFHNALVLSLIPAILWCGAVTASTTSLPHNSSLIVAALLQHLSIFCICLAISRFLFLPNGLGTILFKIPLELGGYLHRSIQFALWSYLILLLPYTLFSLPPLQLQAWPRK